MEKVYIGEFSERQVKNANKEVIGINYFVKLEYRGGHVIVGVDKGYAESLKIDMFGTAEISMEPTMSARSVQDGKFAFIDTGFSNFKLVGFTPAK
jgi:hypothetical protein